VVCGRWERRHRCYTLLIFNWVFAPFLNQNGQIASGVEKRVKFRTFSPPVKNRRGLVEMSIRIRHIRATQILSIGILFTRRRSAVWSHVGRLAKKMNLAKKRWTFGKTYRSGFVAGANKIMIICNNFRALLIDTIPVVAVWQLSKSRNHEYIKKLKFSNQGLHFTVYHCFTHRSARSMLKARVQVSCLSLYR